MLIPGRENNNILNNNELYEDEKSKLERQNIENNYKNLISKSLDIKSYARNNLLGYTP